MSSYGTILQQGNFTQAATAVAKTIQLRADVDWMRVYNLTIADADQTTAVGVEYYWQRGMAVDRGIEYLKSSAANAANLTDYMASGGFTYVDSSLQAPGNLNATITAMSNAAIPVASNSGTNALVAGDVVRILNVASAQQLGGYDFTVGHNTLTTGTFSLDYMAQIVTGTTGSWRKISFDPIFYPRRRSITKITSSGSSSIITMSVTHGFTVGQAVRILVPAEFGMVQMNNLLGNITAINTTVTSGNTITVDIDSSSFTAFAFPLSAVVPFSQAVVVPVGEDTAEALSAGADILSDATLNTGYIGMKLAAGANSPAGAANDQIYWVAGKSWSVDNTI